MRNHRLLGSGIGLRPRHFNHILEHGVSPVDWFEIHSENYFEAGGRHWAVLDRVHAEAEVAMLGVSLGIGDETVQERMRARILLENVSSYVSFGESTLSEWEFIAEVARRADCGILLDVNNVYVSSQNHGFDPRAYIDAIPMERVGQLHLAGHTNSGTYLLDSHLGPIPDGVLGPLGQAPCP